MPVRAHTGATFVYETSIVIEHIRRIRKAFRDLRHALCVIIVENNQCSMRATTLWETIRCRADLGRMLIFSDDPNDPGHCGITLTARIKEAYQMNANSFMHANAIHVSSKMVSVTESLKGMVAEMKTQFEGYQRVPAKNTAPHHRATKYSYSGKASGKDDWIISFLQALYFGTKFFQRMDYLRQTGIRWRSFAYGLIAGLVTQPRMRDDDDDDDGGDDDDSTDSSSISAATAAYDSTAAVTDEFIRKLIIARTKRS